MRSRWTKQGAACGSPPSAMAARREQAGLQAQDIVVGAAGKPVQLLRELTAVLGRMNPGDKLPLEVVRGTRRMHIVVVLGVPAAAPHSAAIQSRRRQVDLAQGGRKPFLRRPAI